MSVSSRDQRVAIYQYAPSNDGGYMTSGYGSTRGTFHCRIAPLIGDELTVAEQADHKERCLFEFADHVTIDPNDLLVDPTTAQWKVESVVLRRNNGARCKIVRAFRNIDEPAVVPT
jgi:hypothetical protein